MEISASQLPALDFLADGSYDGRTLQVKSVDRVRDLGEVFTPAVTVQEMLDLLPADIWEVHPSATFLEPACGDGNFLIAILDRKLGAIAQAEASNTLPAGPTNDAVAFHALEALASIYAVDISIENVAGGTPGHEIGARDRLLNHMKRWHLAAVGARLSEDSSLLGAARWVVDRNIQVGNMLPFNPDGSPSGRDRLPIVAYQWDPTSLSVRLSTTTLGDVSERRRAEKSDAMTLFGVAEPTYVWEGTALQLQDAPIEVPAPTVTHARNGHEKR